MIRIFKPSKPSQYDEPIAALLESIDVNGDVDEAAKRVELVSKLQKLKESEKLSMLPSPDTMLLVAGNLVGILAILNYERANVITSKALSFVMRLK